MKYLALILSLVFSTWSMEAACLTIDEFNGLQGVEVRPGEGQVQSLASSTSAVGGTRGLVAEVTSGTNPFNRLSLSIFGGTLSHSQDAPDIAGYSQITWDGDLQSSVLTPNGLGNLDLLQDGATSIQFEVSSFDKPAGLSINLNVIIYDGIDPTRQSMGTLVISESISQAGPPATLDLPFIAFSTSAGASGPADFNNVGAIGLIIDGSLAPQADVSINWFGTNGTCRLVPNNQGRVIDFCGVCGGDSSSCSDCAGVPYGEAQLDRCNVCNGDGMSCISCTSTEISPLLAAMDGGAKSQEAQVKYLTKVLLKYKNTSSNKKFVGKVQKLAHSLQIRNWTISWWIPSTNITCDNTTFCTATNSESILTEYRQHNDELRDLTLSVASKLKKSGKSAAKIAKSYIKKINKRHQTNLDFTREVPVDHFSCSAP